uniref:HAD family hydrolase n=1 Tax=Candidatus Methanomethylicus mesodigestus TaxID=1867258 RepID=A0A7C3EVB3_9CREN
MQETHRTARHKLRAVIFDMDNTLFEFADAQMAACGAVIDKLGTGSKVALFALFASCNYGFECYENISDYMHRLGIHDEGKFFECCDAYEETKHDSIVVYSGMRESLEELKRLGLRSLPIPRSPEQDRSLQALGASPRA